MKQLVLLFLIGLGSISCSTAVTGIEPTPSKSAVAETIETPNVPAATATFPTPVPTPEYILFVHPELLSLEDYDASRESDFWMVRGITVSFWIKGLGIDKENQDWERIKERIALFVDDVEIPSDTLVGVNDGVKDGGLFRASWAPKVERGLHKATFTITTDSGQKLEYTWWFNIY